MKIEKYFKEITKKNLEINLSDIQKATNLILELKKKNKVILAGNGASSSISSHISIDLTKAANIRAINFNEANLLTCFSNDFGYENWIKKSLKYYAFKEDLMILISSSGKSKNIINAAKFVKKNGMKLITLSGLNSKNPLKKMGDINFFVDSKNYNVVENTHLTIMLSIVENVISSKN
jgi:D-sedoheptulose 7-phosphate isomerase